MIHLASLHVGLELGRRVFVRDHPRDHAVHAGLGGEVVDELGQLHGRGFRLWDLVLLHSLVAQPVLVVGFADLQQAHRRGVEDPEDLRPRGPLADHPPHDVRSPPGLVDEVLQGLPPLLHDPIQRFHHFRLALILHRNPAGIREGEPDVVPVDPQLLARSHDPLDQPDDRVEELDGQRGLVAALVPSALPGLYSLGVDRGGVGPPAGHVLQVPAVEEDVAEPAHPRQPEGATGLAQVAPHDLQQRLELADLILLSTLPEASVGQGEGPEE